MSELFLKVHTLRSFTLDVVRPVAGPDQRVEGCSRGAASFFHEAVIADEEFLAVVCIRHKSAIRDNAAPSHAFRHVSRPIAVADGCRNK